MKRSKRNEGKKKINYAESSVSEGGTIHSDESDYPEEVDCEEVSSVHVVPRIDTYHPGVQVGMDNVAVPSVERPLELLCKRIVTPSPL
ncbi:hypothetical protein U9M48_035915 [Paspalum notatum var. saurae]|uniref:Uncharacterized protein n=1 Tax=Paspalum notatum var. saurae TaxID=547442 RepID=A0AAQ3UI24_PASNO